MGQLLFADAIHIVEQAKIDAARITQKSGNERRGAETALQQFSASLATQRNLDAAGSHINDLAANAARMHEAATRGTMQARIATAEELGAMSAMAGAAGVGGASVEAFNNTVRLQSAIKEAQMERSLDAQGVAIRDQSRNVLKGAVAALDNNVYRANLDYTQYVDHKKPSTFEQIVGVGLTAAATAFGGPQAGAAVMGVFEAAQSSRNADFAGASNALVGSFTDGMGAARAAHRSGGDPGRGYMATHLGKPEQTNKDEWFAPDADGFFFNRRNGPRWGSITIK